MRPTFGGECIHHNGIIIAIWLRCEVRPESDGILAPELEAAGGKRWTYGTEGGKEV